MHQVLKLRKPSPIQHGTQTLRTRSTSMSTLMFAKNDSRKPPRKDEKTPKGADKHKDPKLVAGWQSPRATRRPVKSKLNSRRNKEIPLRPWRCTRTSTNWLRTTRSLTTLHSATDLTKTSHQALIRRLNLQARRRERPGTVSSQLPTQHRKVALTSSN
jgi:hypothetical protein